MQRFFAAVSEVFKLTVLLPFRYLVLTPLMWALTRLGLLAVNPTDVVNRMEAANAAEPLDAARIAAVLRTLNRHHPRAVVEVRECWFLPISAVLSLSFLSLN